MKKLRFENINVDVNASLKVGCYRHCALIGWHIHPEYEVVYIKNGNGVLNIDTKRIPYRNGALLFLGPDIAHTDFGNGDHEDGFEVVVQFEANFLEEKLSLFPELKRVKGLIERSKQVLIFDSSTKEKLAPRFERLASENADYQLLTFLSCLLEMSYADNYHTIFGSRLLPEIKKSADVQRLEQIFKTVNQNFDQPLTSRTIAEQLGMTTNSFCRFFKAKTKKTFLQFLNEYRLERAKDMLMHTETSIKDVMYACGFQDAPYFSRLFKQHFGMSPSSLQQQANPR